MFNIQKNKEERKRVRLIASANKDLTKLEEELQQLKDCGEYFFLFFIFVLLCIFIIYFCYMLLL